MNQDSETVPMNQDAETVPMNKDDSLEQLLSQNFVENDNDSFDDMVSQTSEQEYRQNDSLDEFITQSDQLRESSANSKVNDWLVKENPRPIEAQNKENFQVATKEKNENRNFQVVMREKNVENKLAVRPSNKPLRAENRDNTSRVAQINSFSERRLEMIFNCVSREQDLHQQELDLIKKNIYYQPALRKP